jgi:hypothetical protein
MPAPFTPKGWQDYTPNLRVDGAGKVYDAGGIGVQATPIDAVSLVDLELRLTGYASSLPAARFVFDQPQANVVWVINHALGTFPTVTVIDSAGDEVEGDVEYPTPNQVVLSFSAPFAGTAYLI